MRSLLDTNDAVLLSYVEALLKDAGIQFVVLDRNMSILEGSIGVIPRRVLVDPDAWGRACWLMSDAGLDQWVKADDDGN